MAACLFGAFNGGPPNAWITGKYLRGVSFPQVSMSKESN